jgi:hypothetical protein
MKTNSKPNHFIKIISTLFVFSMLLSGFIQSSDLAIEIDVSPNVLNLENKGEVVTVHTDIAYSLVDGATVTLNGVSIDWWKSDSRGYFVAKFVMDDIKDLPLNINGMNTLVLEGVKTNGETFIGNQEIKVIKVIPVGTGKN